MILESKKDDGSLVFHEVTGFLVRKNGSLQIKEIDGNILEVEDFSPYVVLRLRTNEGNVLYVVRNDTTAIENRDTTPASKPVAEGDNVITPPEWQA